MATSAEIRERLATELRLDLVGPSHRDGTALRDVILPDPPSRWYLTGFLVPLGGAAAAEGAGPRRRRWMPSRRAAPTTTTRRSGIPRARVICRLR